MYLSCRLHEVSNLKKKTEEFQRMAPTVFGFGFFCEVNLQKHYMPLPTLNDFPWQFGRLNPHETWVATSASSQINLLAASHLGIWRFIFSCSMISGRSKDLPCEEVQQNSPIRGPLAVWLGATPSNNALDLEETSTPTQKQQQLDGYTPEDSHGTR